MPLRADQHNAQRPLAQSVVQLQFEIPLFIGKHVVIAVAARRSKTKL